MSGHPPRLPGGMALTATQRAFVCCRIAALDEHLAPAGEREAGARFTALLLAFPAAPLSETAAKLRAAAYFEALEGEPGWAIAAACRYWLRGEGQGELSLASLAFAPSPPQLRRLVEGETLPVRHQRARLMRLLEAEAEPAPGLREEGRAAMAARFEALARSLG